MAMTKKVLIIDTSILCVWLQVRGFDSCGKDTDRWDYERVNRKIEDEKSCHTTFVLPLATIIETGNHIAQASGDIKPFLDSFTELIMASADNQTPWAAFTEQNCLWTPENLKVLTMRWKEIASSGLSLGDATIVDVANYYVGLGFSVEILTGDAGLKSYEPTIPATMRPRRRK